ncbi:MAG: hypothetical protein DMG06_03870 [Acidobacteria bacterium]|nr:MAG: hypothetical protein DMG06_03870 [Acidobacteriota bacterium]
MAVQDHFSAPQTIETGHFACNEISAKAALVDTNLFKNLNESREEGIRSRRSMSGPPVTNSAVSVGKYAWSDAWVRQLST